MSQKKFNGLPQQVLSYIIAMFTNITEANTKGREISGKINRNTFLNNETIKTRKHTKGREKPMIQSSASGGWTSPAEPRLSNANIHT